MASIRMALGLRFVARSSLIEGPEGALADVLPLSAQYRWLAESAGATHELDPGTPDPNGNYSVEPFKIYLDDLLAGLPDGEVDYTCGEFLLAHTIRNTDWVPGIGHIFVLLADGQPLVQEASIGGGAYDVEILIGLEVLD